jgi:hypothetical protein
MRQIEVSKSQFFTAVGQRDIITSAHGSSKDERGTFSIFKTRDGAEVGRIHYGKPNKAYVLNEEVANKTA